VEHSESDEIRKLHLREAKAQEETRALLDTLRQSLTDRALIEKRFAELWERPEKVGIRNPRRHRGWW
jgi:hypothetical protein